ncbi:MAG: long-chain fatty acid--CoA ligase [Bacteroidales bacterium]|nr:long-chain fatty acid--CoA ligase [Candidatus Minthousia equi]
MSYTVFHLGILPEEQVKRWGDRVALRYRDDQQKKWLPITWPTVAAQVSELACAMLGHGVKIQENMAVFTENSPKGIVTDLAAFAIRAVTIPLYATSSAAQVKYIIDDAEIRLLFVGGQVQYDISYQVLNQCPTLEKIIIFDANVKKKAEDNTSIYLDEFINEVSIQDYKAQVEELRSQCSEDDIANILYTSGTTGEPKGVTLHHSCFTAQFYAHFEVLGESLFVPNSVSMNFLPLTHVFERAWTFLCMEAGIEVCVNHDPRSITRSLLEVRPNMMCAVPRFWEKVYDGVQQKIATFPGILRALIKHALKLGKKHNLEYLAQGKKPSFLLHFKYSFYKKTIFRMLSKAIGLEKGTFFPTAGAAIPPAIEEFVHSVGIGMIAGYGLTESTATVSCDQGIKTIGSIGRPLPGVQVKIGENDEILVKGPNITHGYYKKEEANREAFDADGFFHTGDAGYIKDGELFITDRIKDLYKTSNGKYIAPQVLESLLCVDKYIDQISIIADKRKFVSALIVPAYAEIEKYAKENNISYASMSELLANKEIYTMLEKRINALQHTLASYEKVKRFTLLPEPFSMAKGEITNTLKVKRSVLLQNYATEISKMYEE